MSSERRQGMCLLCRKEISLDEAEPHLRHCLEESTLPTRDASSLLILAESVRYPQYWMVLILRCNAEIFDLESLIRDIWFESGSDEAYCRIKKSSYFTHPDINQLDMYRLIRDLVQSGDQITYRYGKWSDDTVHMTVLGEIGVAPQNSIAYVLARNNLPAEKCMICGDDASYGVDNSRVLGGPQYICTTCILTNERGMRENDIQPLYNSPRMTFCYESEDLRSALCWYPPGYAIEDLYPLKDSLILSLVLNIPTDTNKTQYESLLKMIIGERIYTAIGELSDAISEFAGDEYCEYGRMTAIRSTMIIVSTIIAIYRCSCRDYHDWDAESVADCLEEELAALHSIHPSWRSEILPTLTRFFIHLDKEEIIRNADTLIKSISHREAGILRQFIGMQIEMSRFREFQKAIITEYGRVFDVTSSTGRVLHAASPICQVGPRTLKDVLRQIDEMMILMEENVSMSFDDEHFFPSIVIKIKCSAFLSHTIYFPENEITEHCNNIIELLTFHPNLPLTRGDPDLWAASIVYYACRNPGLPGFDRKKKEIKEIIAEFYKKKPESIQSKLRAILQYLPG